MTRKINLSEAVRGLLVAIIASLIINFMVLIIGPILPILSYDGIIPLLIFIITIILTLVTYFLLPTEKEQTEKSLEPLIQLNTEN
ncbi:MAG: hypothetical protein ACXAC2_08945 [Candidatus Kariarchaeaceae archaeon]|jgi:hypothetical protein